MPKGVHLPAVTLSCKQCSAEFTVPGSQVLAYGSRKGSVRQFCSMECSVAGRALTEVPTFECEHCKKTVERRRNHFANGRLGGYVYHQRFCSKECGDAARSSAARHSHCLECGKPLLPYPRIDAQGRSRGMIPAPKKFCSQACGGAAIMRGAVGRGRGHTDKHGYKIINIDGRQVPEHRAVMQRMLGRPLRPSETVHHKNGDRQLNHESNLELWHTGQPSGQRVADKAEWALQFFKEYPDALEALGYELILRDRNSSNYLDRTFKVTSLGRGFDRHIPSALDRLSSVDGSC